MIKERIIKAYEFSKDAHRGQIRKYSDLPYFVHPKYVARIIEDLTKNEDLIVAALLHDIVEDTEKTLLDIQLIFGSNVANIVDQLTTPKDINKKEHLVFTINTMDEGSFLIKLVDRYHNIFYIDKDCKTKQHEKFIQKYYKETQYLYDAAIKSRINIINETGCIYKKQISLIGDMIKNKLQYLQFKFNF